MDALILSAFLLASAIAPQREVPRTSEVVDVNVIEIDVVVVGADGNAVAGLKKNDFELRIGGRKRPISNFYAIDGKIDRSVAPTAEKAAEAVPLPRREYLVLFVDDSHLRQAAKKRALDALRSFVRKRIGRGTMAMLVRSAGDLHIARRFTDDPALLLSAIDAIEREPSQENRYDSERREVLRQIDMLRDGWLDKRAMAEPVRRMITDLARQEQLRTERTIAALERAVDLASGLEGRRVLVYLSDGLPMQPGAEIYKNYKFEEFFTGDIDDLAMTAMADQQALDAMETNLSTAFSELARRASLAGVQLFAIDAGGNASFEDLFHGLSVKSQTDVSLIRANLHGPLHLLADETGGRAIVNENDIGRAFENLGDHLSTYYSLGFRSDDSGRDESVSVHVKKRGLTVRAARHVRQRTTREQIANRVRSALYTPIGDNPLDADIAVTPVGGSEPGVTAMIRVPLTNLSILPGASDAAVSYAVFVGMIDDNMHETPVRMFVLRTKPSESDVAAVHPLRLNVSPGTYTISFAIVDGFSWQTSYVQREVTVPAR